MTEMIRRLGWLLIATPAALLAVFASTVDAAVIHYPPACRAGTWPGAANPPLACVDRTYRSDAYTTAPTETSLSVSHRLVRNHGYPYVLVTVKVGFANALPECPEGGVPLGDIPASRTRRGSARSGATCEAARGCSSRR